MLYQRAGVVIAVSSSILAVATYLLLGPSPLLALWIGLAVVGASMALTPPEPRPVNVSKLVLDAFENVERVLEALGARGSAVLVPTDSGVYAVIGDSVDPSRLSSEDVRSRLVLRAGRSLAVSLKVPLPEVESESPCEALGETVVDRLGIATGLECVEDESRGELSARFHNAKAVGFSRMSEVAGPIHGVIAAALLARIREAPARVASWRRVGSDLEVRAEVLRS